MELTVAIEERRAVRQFEPAPVSNEDLRKLINAAIWAPSAINRQPWRFAVITDPLVLQAVEAKAKSWLLEKAPDGPLEPQLRALLKDPKYHLLHHAPALIVIGAPRQEKWAAEDCAMAAQNLMLRAAEFGLGTCWIGLVQDWLNTPEGLATLKFPSGVKIVAPIIVGEPSGQIGRGTRKAPNIVWIGPEGGRFHEEKEAAETEGRHALYGTLLHP